MKKILLSAMIASAATLSFAEQKTVTFDFSNPAAYGYAEPEATKGTPLKIGDKIEADGVCITNTSTKESETAVRFFNSSGTITFRLASDGSINITAGGNKIVGLDIKGSNCNYNTNFTATPTATWESSSWKGEADAISIVRKKDKTVTMTSMTVTYDTNAGGGGGTTAKPEKYTAISWDGTAYTVSDEFKAVVEDSEKGGIANNAVNGKSLVKFGTTSIEAVAVGGSNPKDVTEVEAGVFPGWTDWNDVKWDFKNQGDILFAYIGGSGNPYVEISQEAVVTEGIPNGNWRPSYVYFGPKEEVVGDKSYRKALPVNGVYYKFSAKADGLLLMSIWSNKGNHNTYVVDESTLEIIPFRCEGYINGQTYKTENGDPEELNGKKKWLSSDEIKGIHDASKCEKDADGNIIPNTDSAPYVIGAGNQPFWGKIVFEVKKDQTYWVFQASTQIGFQGFEFTPNGKDDGGSLNGISQTKAIANAVIFDILGNRVNKMERGKLYIQNGKKVIVR